MNYNFNMNKKYMNKLEAKIKELEEENKVLKELNVCIGCEDNPTYKARIDKAIRILNSAKNHYDNDKTNWAIERTLRVLKRSDDDDNT